MKAQEALDTLAQQISVCTKCELYKGRTWAVPGEGPTHAEIMFIGEGPGASEDKHGHPFVGAAGKFLDQLLAQAGVTRADVWITNVVKCRPPGNRDPQIIEIETCTTNYLEHQIKIVNPSIIVTLVRHSLSRFIPDAKITQIHGQMHRVGRRFLIPMFHPAAALHQERFRPFIAPGAQSTGTGKGWYCFNRPAIIRHIECHLRTAPTSGTTFKVDVNKGGTTMLASVIAFTASDKNAGKAPDSATYAQYCFAGNTLASGTTITDELTYDIDAVGSTVAGSDIGVFIRFTEYMDPFDPHKAA